MAYVGNIGDKITLDVVLINIYSWIDYSFNYRGTTKFIYTMQDKDDNTFVWKTGTCISCETGKDKNGNTVWHYPQKNDKIKITGTVKDHSVYKDVEQTVLQRVKVQEFIEKSVTYQEKKAAKQKEQFESLSGEDFIWEMPYKQYKEHYSDCETIYGSYNDHSEEFNRSGIRIPATIEVIIREGRLKASGVRGEHFSGYIMENELGQQCTYRAVSEENALKRVSKEFPDHDWKCTRIYTYGRF